MRCTGNCQQGRKPCDCPLNADHGDFVSPTVKLIQNLILLAVLIIALVGLLIIILEAV